MRPAKLKRRACVVHTEHREHMSNLLEVEIRPRLKRIQTDFNRQKNFHIGFFFLFTDEVHC